MTKKLLLLAAIAISTSLINPTTALAETEQTKKKLKNSRFHKADTNQDGQITEAEFLEKAKKRFKKMDKNSDGVITKEEGKKAHQQRKKTLEKWKNKREEYNQ